MKKSIGYRMFLVRGDDATPLSKTAFEEFLFRRQAVLHDFAGKSVDIATVVCRLENKKPKEIVRIYCQRFRVKGDGSIEGPDTRGRREKVNDDSDQLHGVSLARSLVMISSAAQRKIFEVLRASRDARDSGPTPSY